MVARLCTQPHRSGLWGPAIVVLLCLFLKNSLVGSIVLLLKIPHKGAPVSPQNCALLMYSSHDSIRIAGWHSLSSIQNNSAWLLNGQTVKGCRCQKKMNSDNNILVYNTNDLLIITSKILKKYTNNIQNIAWNRQTLR